MHLQHARDIDKLPHLPMMLQDVDVNVYKAPDRTASAIRLAKVVTSVACRIWLGPGAPVADELIDLLAGKGQTELQRHRAIQVFDRCTDAVVARILRDNDYFTNLPAYEREAAVLAVEDTLRSTSMDARQFGIATSLNPDAMMEYFAPAKRSVLDRALLSTRAEVFFNRVLEDTCRYVAEVVKTLPGFSENALAELLARQDQLLIALNAALLRQAWSAGVKGFPSAYERLVASELDRMELFGISVRERATQVYLLSPSYVEPALRLAEPAAARTEAPEPAERVLHRHRRLLIRGDAGSGKTTLLRALAVRSARKQHTGELSDWNELTPFFLPLRAYHNGPFPAPSEFVRATADVVAGEMPDHWVHDLMSSGRAIVLVDGLDEVAIGAPRTRAREWLRRLVTQYETTHFIVTSRPAAVDPAEFKEIGFMQYDVEPMDLTSTRWLIERWHQTLGATFYDQPDVVDDIIEDQRSLLSAIETDKRLRLLAQNPLLCALLCALNHDRRRHLPRKLMAIYRAALQMFLERRDVERDVELDLRISYEELEFLLADLAFFLITNGWSDVSTQRATRRIKRALTYLPTLNANPTEILKFLLERTGMLRSPAEGSIDFVHRTFQEFLAAKRLVDDDSIGELVAKASDDQWRNVVVMSAGHAPAKQASELLTGILDRCDSEPGDRLKVLAINCLQTVTSLDPDVYARLSATALSLLPPKDSDTAEALAFAGPYIMPALHRQVAKKISEAAGLVRTASMIGGESAIALIRILAAQFDGLDPELSRASVYFDAEAYTREVLANARPCERFSTNDLRLLKYLNLIDWLKNLEIVGVSDSTKLLSARPGEHITQLRLSRLSAPTLLGIRSWHRVRRLDLDIVGRVPGLVELQPMSNLEELRLAFTIGRVMQLDDLAGLPKLRSLVIARLDSIVVDLTAFGQKRDLVVTVPADAVVTNPHNLHVVAEPVTSFPVG